MNTIYIKNANGKLISTDKALNIRTLEMMKCKILSENEYHKEAQHGGALFIKNDYPENAYQMIINWK